MSSTVFGLDQALDTRIKQNSAKKQKKPANSTKPNQKQKNKPNQRPASQTHSAGQKQQQKGKNKQQQSKKLKLADIRISVVNDKVSKLKNKSGKRQQQQQVSGKVYRPRSPSQQINSSQKSKVKRSQPLFTPRKSPSDSHSDVPSLKVKALQTEPKAESRPKLLKVKVWNIRVNIDTKMFRSALKDIEGLDKAEIVYDKSGNSTGTGIVRFTKETYASSFVRDYDHIDLDGQPMKLEILDSSE